MMSEMGNITVDCNSPDSRWLSEINIKKMVVLMSAFFSCHLVRCKCE